MGLIMMIVAIFLGVFSINSDGVDNNFNTYYSYLWGGDHFSINSKGDEVQLKIDPSSGAGFSSKSDYGSGLFGIKMKIPNPKTGGIVTSFYLTSVPLGGSAQGNHFEVDFEFLGTNGTLQTNVYDQDQGHREQSFNLGFDPSQNFHTYSILWNAHNIIFVVDNIPMREFKNNEAKGIAYPTTSMHIEASIWHADWAGEVDWSHAPFIAHYRDFGLYACATMAQSGDVSQCSSPQYFWNGPAYRSLSDRKRHQMMEYRKSHLIYDYCANPNTRKQECSYNN